ncbi:unnamed protein product [Candidula unifasciata]|uniref:Uncharacterized protein n=1 Tax=Candidula unifasciata TaxID=100452 RepID=A0A8S3YK29_9EUPU|nr:unnamed protein product [Candidula unifasciata]
MLHIVTVLFPSVTQCNHLAYIYRARTPAKIYTSPGHLITFGSPRSPASSSSLSHQPRSLSTSMSSETAKKRIWEDTTPTTSGSGTTLSHRLSSDSPLHILGLSETSGYKPNISFSDDSVTANATVGNHMRPSCDDKHDSLTIRTDISDGSRRQTSYLPTVEKFVDVKHNSPTTASNLTSTQRHKLSPSILSDTSLTANLSRIPVEDSSTRHGMFVDSVILSEPTRTARSTKYVHRHPVSETGSSNVNDLSNNGTGGRSCNRPTDHSNNRSVNVSKIGLHGKSSQRTPVNDTQNTLMGEGYSLGDVHDVLDEASTVGTHRDDDNTTTTSGSYTINADDLRQEIDQLFFNDVVV